MKKVLLFTQDLKTVQMIQHIITISTQTHFVFDHLTDYDKALKTVQAGQCDICYIDVDQAVPEGRDCYDFLRGANAKHIKVPIILLAEAPDRIKDMEAMYLGASDFLVKSFISPESFERSFRYALERKNVMGELYERVDQIKTQDAIRNDMVRIAAHDIRSPLTSVLMSCHILMERGEITTELQEKHIKRIWDATRSIQRTVTEILSMEYLEDLANGELKDFTVEELIENVLADLNAEIDQKNQRVNVKNECPKILISCDRVQFKHVIENLISNAIKYSEDGSEITIHVINNNAMLYFEVIDQGYGIPESQQDKLFQPFSRINIDETSDIDGTGLGLYLVKRIIDRYNGRIFFRSTYQVGSTFGFEIPLSQVS